MTRLIDADALSKRLEALWNVHDDQDFANKDVWHELESAPTIDAELQWIPCSERLPEVRQWVLCSCRAVIMDVLRLTNDGSWEKDYPYVAYRSDFVVAWMPLPKPYEAERKEE